MSTVPPDGPTGPASDPDGGTTPRPEQPAYGAPNPPEYGATPQYGAAPPYGAGPQYGAAPQYSVPPAYGAPAAPLTPADERLWATLAHIGPIILAFLAPLIIWLVFKDRSRFVDQEAKESLNFQILLVVASIVFAIITVITLGIGSFLFLAFIAALVFMIQGAIAANRGQPYRYPVNWRVIK